ncbi:MAG: hypothetical protein MRZ79_16180, partial [Bacteroidia bacterium]|nr:hypothetical protein [Bacteroidia bacterium]
MVIDAITKEQFDQSYGKWWLETENQDLHEVFKLNGDLNGYAFSFKLDNQDALGNLLGAQNLKFHLGQLETLGANDQVLFRPYVEGVGLGGANFYPMSFDENFLVGMEPIESATAQHFRDALEFIFQDSSNFPSLYTSFHVINLSEDPNSPLNCGSFANKDQCRIKSFTLKTGEVDDFQAVRNELTSGGNIRANSVLKIHLGHSSRTSSLPVNVKLVVEVA